MQLVQVANYMAIHQSKTNNNKKTKKKMVEAKITQKVKAKAKEIQIEIFKSVLPKKSKTFLGRIVNTRKMR